MGRKSWGGIVEVYSDGTNVFFKIDKPPCKFVFNGEELVSYGSALSDGFYINHFGEKVKGRIVEGEKFSVRERGSELEIEVKRGGFGLWFSYIPFGRRLAPFIKVAAKSGEILILPEINRIYQGKEIQFKNVSGGIHVLERYAEEFDIFARVYMLMPNGKECLMYDGPYYTYLCTPYKLYKLRGDNVWIIEFVAGREAIDSFKKYFCKTPEFSYLFVRSYKEGVVEFSFDMNNWINVRASEMVFEYEPELESKGSYSSLKHYGVSEETIRGIERKLQKALEEIEEPCFRRLAECGDTRISWVDM